VFLKLEVSWVLAASPIKRCFVPKATNDLVDFQHIYKSTGQKFTYGVARLDTSFTMMSIPRCLATPIWKMLAKQYENRLVLNTDL